MSQWHNYLSCGPRYPRRLIGALSLLAMALGATAAFSQEYTPIRRLGTSNAVSRPGPSSREDLQNVFNSNRADYEKVLRDTNWPGDPADLFRAIEEGSFTEARYPVGHTFEWMAVRKRGVVQATGPIRWEGTAPFDAFEIRFESEGMEHRFLIPKACGNLSLIEMRELPPPFRIEDLVPNLRVQSPNQCTGVNVTVDVTTQASMPEGATLNLTMTRPNGQTQTLEPTPAGGGYRWTGTLEDAGGYTFAAVVDTSLGPTRQTTERINIEPCPPTCSIVVTPPPMDPTPKAGRASVGIDMSGSSAQVGQLTSRTVRVHHTPIDGPEQLVETLSLDQEPNASYLMPEYGTYRFEATVTDDRGMTASCQGDYTLMKPPSELFPFFTVFGGKERRVREFDRATGEPAEDNATDTYLSGRCAPLFGGTLGLAITFADGGAQIFGQGGVAINTRDSENTSLFADVGLDKLFEGGAFLGAGVGVWDLSHSDTIDGSVFVHGGTNITDRLQWNVEGRLFMSEMDAIENNYAILAGIRYFWTR